MTWVRSPHPRLVLALPAQAAVIVLTGGTVIDGNGIRRSRTASAMIDGDRILAVGGVEEVVVPGRRGIVIHPRA